MAIGVGADAGLVLSVLLKSSIPAVTTDCQTAKVQRAVQQFALCSYLWAKESWIETPSFENKGPGFEVYLSDP